MRALVSASDDYRNSKNADRYGTACNWLIISNTDSKYLNDIQKGEIMKEIFEEYGSAVVITMIGLAVSGAFLAVVQAVS